VVKILVIKHLGSSSIAVCESGFSASLAWSRFKVFTKLSAIPLLCELFPGVVTGLSPNCLAKPLVWAAV
jgi:hypothetical protein